MPTSTLQTDLLVLSQGLLRAAKLDQPYQAIRESLANASWQDLLVQLDTQDKKLVFWINLYNAFVQIILKEQPELYHQSKQLFTQKLIVIANQKISLDLIEHGILRHSQFKYGFGYVPKLFSSSFEKKLRLKKRDPRVHFALNCGAESCPPILFYRVEALEEQLETATLSYLESETKYVTEKNEVWISKLMLWFRGDFGGKKGILQFLKKYQIIPNSARPRLRYQKYNRQLSLKKFAE